MKGIGKVLEVFGVSSLVVADIEICPLRSLNEQRSSEFPDETSLYGGDPKFRCAIVVRSCGEVREQRLVVVRNRLERYLPTPLPIAKLSSVPSVFRLHIIPRLDIPSPPLPSLPFLPHHGIITFRPQQQH
jgi:hypothetical protein